MQFEQNSDILIVTRNCCLIYERKKYGKKSEAVHYVMSAGYNADTAAFSAGCGVCRGVY